VERNQAYIQNFQSKGYGLLQAQEMANRAMEGTVLKQTMLLTYDQLYLLIGVFVLCCIPVVYLQKFKKKVVIPADLH
jgi:DHA2 family multidrug resistance protein